MTNRALGKTVVVAIGRQPASFYLWFKMADSMCTTVLVSKQFILVVFVVSSHFIIPLSTQIFTVNDYHFQPVSFTEPSSGKHCLRTKLKIYNLQTPRSHISICTDEDQASV
jgi:hypothetical protein